MKFWSLILVCLMVFSSLDADAARRMGGGGSVGRQSGNVTQRDGGAAPAASPGAAQNQAARPATPGAAPAAAAAPRRPWGAMLGGLAAGLGLAWLASSLGLGAGFAQFLMFALLALVIMAVVGFIIRSRRNSAGASTGPAGRPFAFQGAGSAAADMARAPSQYSPDKVGNDASARPWERNSMAFEASKQGSSGLQIGSALAGGSPSSWSVPPGFDADGFLTAAKRNFVTLQQAWDGADIPALQAMMTDEMLGEIRAQLAQRETHVGEQANKTDVVMLEAKLLGIEDLGEHYMASVEFSGMIREEPSSGPSPFREVWNMTKPKSGTSGWLVAGVQALQ